MVFMVDLEQRCRIPLRFFQQFKTLPKILLELRCPWRVGAYDNIIKVPLTSPFQRSAQTLIFLKSRTFFIESGGSDSL
jgi:hypothetical protein